MWLLLHYEDIQAPISRNEVMRRLRTYIPGYEKGAKRTFSITKNRLPVATQRAQGLAARFTARSEPEPFTAIAELVALLTQLRAL